MQCAEMQNLLAFNAMVALRIIRCTGHEDGSNSAKLKVFHLYCTDRVGSWITWSWQTLAEHDEQI
jgi:hypothetical protein